ncbi:Flp pilus assembly protein, ATPase CpaE [Comamonas testosteroni]|uniref:Flp pilus assembly protein, ATPase CpaE n=2 Tax=Comamonas testosteroni TaxID=285 RepID=A0A8B4SA60_COMTE|nr:response regulator receiver protein [Comamonas testosteroni ATCC 11996]SUY80002.1 Flp pilus assembly protein, ATPase CpaE [Comamonas testosteroni]
MNMRMDSSQLNTAQPGSARSNVRVVLVTQSSSHAFWLASALGSDAEVIPVAGDLATLHAAISAPGLGVVVADFSAPMTEAAIALVSELRAAFPGVVIMGSGSAAEPASMRAALRCGVAEFIDWDATEGEASAVIRHQMHARTQLPAAVALEPETKGFSLPLLGARVGMGVTTLATHLAVMFQEMHAYDVRGAQNKKQLARPFGASQLPQDESAHAALLDLGLPARDGLLYLGIAGDFSFVDAVQNTRRLDATLINSAFAKHSTGTVTLAWPSDLGMLREVSPAAAAGVVSTLKSLLGVQVIDLGGMVQADFLAPLLRESGLGWVVCDQSLGGIVSTAQMLKELDAKGVNRGTLKLVLNRFNAQAGLPAKEVAQRLGLELLHVVPDRSTVLLNAASCGQLLSQSLRGDPYVTCVRSMARALLSAAVAADKVAAPVSGVLGQWAKRLRRGE